MRNGTRRSCSPTKNQPRRAPLLRVNHSLERLLNRSRLIRQCHMTNWRTGSTTSMEAEDGCKKGRAKEAGRAQIRKGGEQTRRERHAPEKERNAQERSRRKRRHGEEPETGDRHR